MQKLPETRTPSSTTFNANGLLGSQKELLPRLYQSHRLLVLFFYATFLLIPIWFLWIVCFAAVIAESYIWFLRIISPVLFCLPIVVISIFPTVKAFVTYMRSAKRILDTARADVDSSRIAENFTTYMNLLFTVLQPSEAAPNSTSEKQKHIRGIIMTLKIFPLVARPVWVIVILSFGSFFIRYPHIIPLLLLTPLLPVLVFSMALGFVHVGLFIKWRHLISRWLNIYKALTDWQADLESTIQQSANDTGLMP